MTKNILWQERFYNWKKGRGVEYERMETWVYFADRKNDSIPIMMETWNDGCPRPTRKYRGSADHILGGKYAIKWFLQNGWQWLD